MCAADLSCLTARISRSPDALLVPSLVRSSSLPCTEPRTHGVLSCFQIVAVDKHVLDSEELGPISRSAGSTSNVLYFRGEELWVACSGDSRAIMGRRSDGKVSAVELSIDHKPDLPDERRRIERAGGVISAAGPNGLPPSRVWVNGRVGLAMSRSIGDGEAKGHGVIPDPEFKQLTLSPAPNLAADGDAFVVVASDGIWEFVSSQQACDVIDGHTSARAACEALVKLAEQRWKEEEGSYRDDITCIVAFLPFLEDRGDEQLELIATGHAAAGSHFQQQSDVSGGAGAVETGGEDAGKAAAYMKRRLSTAGGPVDLEA